MSTPVVDEPLNTTTSCPEGAIVKKSHRIQTNIPVENAIKTEISVGTDKKQVEYRNLGDTPQVGILTGTTAYEKAYTNTDDILKHLCVAYLCTVLKPPSKWTPETFADVTKLESGIEQTQLTTKLPIRKDAKTYHIHLSSTLVKGRFSINPTPYGSRRQIRLGVHRALARIQRGKAAIWTCDAHFFLIRRVQEGFYFYAANLQGQPALMFFMCYQLMVSFVQETYGCTDRSKYFLSNVMLHSVEEEDTVRIVWKMKRHVGMKLENDREAILHGNICLTQPSLERSLEIGLNVLDRRSESTCTAAGQLVTLMRDRNESSFEVGPYRIACRTTAIGHRQRKHFEELVNYFLASCTALLVVGLDCCFLLWPCDDFIHWFSPYRYSTLRDQPAQVANRASFLHMTNALAKTSQSLYEYLFELGLFPDHTVELLPLRVDSKRPSDTTTITSDGEDSLDQEGITISPAGDHGWNSFYAPTSHSPSELRLARQVLDVVCRTAEDRIA